MTAPIPTDLTTLLQKLDEPQARYAELDRYYAGTQPLAFLSPETKVALRARFGRMASTSLGWRSGFSDPDKLATAIDDLLAQATSGLARPTGDIGQGPSQSPATVDLAALLRQRAQ